MRTQAAGSRPRFEARARDGTPAGRPSDRPQHRGDHRARPVVNRPNPTDELIDRTEPPSHDEGAGVTPRVVQRLMRHSTLELTGRYTRPRAVDIDKAADSFPSLRPDADRPKCTTLAATGTDGQPISKAFAEYLPNSGDGLGGICRILT